MNLERLDMTLTLAAAALIALGCAQPEPAEIQAEKTLPAVAEKPDENSAKDPAGKPELKEEDVAGAKKRAEEFMRDFGPKLMANLADKNVSEFRKGLAGGVELKSMKKYDVAISAVRSALATKPNDARALAALSDVALAGGDLGTAEATALLGIGRAFDRRVAVRIDRLLDDIAAKRGMKLQATAGLGRTERVGSSTEPLGPAADLDALCKLLEPVVPKDPSGINCLPPRAKRIKASGGPLLEAAYLPVITAKTETHYIIALRVEAGWYAVAEMAQVSELKTFYAAPDKFEVTRFEISQLIPGDAEELLIDFTHVINDCDPGINEREEGTRKTVMVCGLKEGKPGCFIRIPYLLERKRLVISEKVEKEIDQKEHTGTLPFAEFYALKVDFVPKDGTVEVTKAAGEVPADRQRYVGTHTL